MRRGMLSLAIMFVCLSLFITSASGCTQLPLPLGSGAGEILATGLTFATGSLFGFLASSTLPAQMSVEHSCQRNGEPIDCSEIPGSTIP